MSTLLGCADFRIHSVTGISEALTWKPSEVELYQVYSHSLGCKSGFPPETGRNQGLRSRNRSGVECSRPPYHTGPSV